MAEFDVRGAESTHRGGAALGRQPAEGDPGARAIAPVRLVIANQPTRGLDVGSVEYVHRRLIALRDGGAAVLLVSTELDELLAVADRIAVLYRGRVVATLRTAEATAERLGLFMSPGVGRRPEATRGSGQDTRRAMVKAIVAARPPTRAVWSALRTGGTPVKCPFT